MSLRSPFAPSSHWLWAMVRDAAVVQAPLRWWGTRRAGRPTRARGEGVSTERPAPGTETTEPTTLGGLALFFLKYGVLPAGGKPIPTMFEELVRRRRWLSNADFIEGQTLGRLLPGPNGPNTMALFGQAMHGPAGAILAVSLYMLPGALVMLLLCGLVLGHDRPAWIAGGMRGLAAAGVALFLSATWHLLPSGRGARFGPLLMGLAFVYTVALGFDLLTTMIGLGLLSLALNRPQGESACGTKR